MQEWCRSRISGSLEIPASDRAVLSCSRARYTGASAVNELGCSGPQKDLTDLETSIEMGRREGELAEESDVQDPTRGSSKTKTWCWCCVNKPTHFEVPVNVLEFRNCSLKSSETRMAESRSWTSVLVCASILSTTVQILRPVTPSTEGEYRSRLFGSQGRFAPMVRQAYKYDASSSISPN
jgi:hypothetical protein